LFEGLPKRSSDASDSDAAAEAFLLDDLTVAYHRHENDDDGGVGDRERMGLTLGEHLGDVWELHRGSD
jgi:hypothetical protein